MKTMLMALSACVLMSGCVVEAEYPTSGYTQSCDENGENCEYVRYYAGTDGVIYYWYGGVWIGPGHPYYERYHYWHTYHGSYYRGEWHGGSYHGGGYHGGGMGHGAHGGHR
jgi:hypothetical protein